MNQKILVPATIIIVALLAILYLAYSSPKEAPVAAVNQNPTTITYKNTDYGFDFSLPLTWQGYTIINETWKGIILKGTVTQSGPKLLIRNPKWTTSLPYEDLPILVFTIAQWNAYLVEDFSISAAPIQATELGRNNTYVFALPPRWNFDYSLDFKEAQDIIDSRPLNPFNIGASDVPIE